MLIWCSTRLVSGNRQASSSWLGSKSGCYQGGQGAGLKNRLCEFDSHCPRMTSKIKFKVLVARSGWKATNYSHTIAKGNIELQWNSDDRVRMFIASKRYTGTYERQEYKLCKTRGDIDVFEKEFLNSGMV